MVYIKTYNPIGGADVNIYTSSPKQTSLLHGNVENTQVGVFLRTYLDVDVDAITNELLKSGTGPVGDWGGQRYFEWMGQEPEDGERLDGQAHLGVDGHGDDAEAGQGNGDLEARHYGHRTSVRCEVCGVLG